eukprot:9050646-Alexandrium_andersonii.AAC.1
MPVARPTRLQRPRGVRRARARGLRRQGPEGKHGRGAPAAAVARRRSALLLSRLAPRSGEGEDSRTLVALGR